MLSKASLRPYLAEFRAIGALGEATQFTLNVHATSCEEAMEILQWSYREIVGEHGANLDRTGGRFQYRILHAVESELDQPVLAH